MTAAGWAGGGVHLGSVGHCGGVTLGQLKA